MTAFEFRVKQWQDEVELRRAELELKRIIFEEEMRLKRDELELARKRFEADAKLANWQCTGNEDV